MGRKTKKSLSAAASAEIKANFDLGKFKSKKGLDKNIKFKDQEWIPLSPAFGEVTSVPGIPMGHIVLLRGHSDTGKTTAMIEAAVSAQNNGILPVFIITEMKWNWEHAKQMGLQVDEVVDKDTGEITNYEGEFIPNLENSWNLIYQYAKQNKQNIVMNNLIEKIKLETFIKKNYN